MGVCHHLLAAAPHNNRASLSPRHHYIAGRGEWADAHVLLYPAVKCEPLTQVDKGYLSEPRRIEFLTAGGATAHMHFYPPANRDFRAMPGELPPLRVHVHGGPTAEAGDELQLVHQYWTSRGAPGCFSSRLTYRAVYVKAGVVGGQLRAYTESHERGGLI